MLTKYMKTKIRKALDIHKNEEVVATKLNISYALVASVSITKRRLRKNPAETFASLKRILPHFMATSLTAEEQELIRLRYFNGNSDEDTANARLCTKGRIYHQRKATLLKLKKAILGVHETPSAAAMPMENLVAFNSEMPKLMTAFLTKQEEDIIRLRYYNSETYEGIGAYYSRTKAWAYGEVQSALAKLKKAILNVQPTPSA